MPTIDPSKIQDASQIPPPGARPIGLSPAGLVEVSCGTLPGDVDAQPAAAELIGSAPDTGGLSNADYVYRQVSALYGEASLPDFQTAMGNNVKSIVFVSGSANGGYGAFHIGNGNDQANFDRIVADSLNVSGDYSGGSSLGSALKPLRMKVDRLFAATRGPGELLGIVHEEDARVKEASLADIRAAHLFALRSLEALRLAHEARDVSARSKVHPSSHEVPATDKATILRSLVRANREILGLVRALSRATGGRQHLSTALFAAEIIESFQTLTHRSDPGKTDGESFSRVIAFKLTPEIALVPGFSAGIAQQWWQDGHRDWVNDNSADDQSTDGNGAGVMFLLYLNDYLGISLAEIIQQTPTTDGAPLGETYANLVQAHPELSGVAGADGRAAFKKMTELLAGNVQLPDGTLNLPADGNPFPGLPGAKSGGLFAPNTPQPLAQDAQAALALEGQLEQQLASLKTALQRVQGDLPAGLRRREFGAYAGPRSIALERAAFSYGPPLPSSVVATLSERVAPFRAPQYDGPLQATFWPHVYNELPGTGTNTNRLQVITGSIQTPEAVQITGTISETKAEKDGDLHIAFQPDDPAFPTNQSGGTEPPLELEIIYAGPVTQADAKQAQQGYTNPFDVSQLKPGVRIQAAGPLIFDRAHGRVDSAGNVQYGLEIHPIAGLTILGAPEPVPPSPPPAPDPVPPPPSGQLASDLASALGQAGALSQALDSLTALIRKMQGTSTT
jgi:hypothetical protein